MDHSAKFGAYWSNLYTESESFTCIFVFDSFILLIYESKVVCTACIFKILFMGMGVILLCRLYA